MLTKQKDYCMKIKKLEKQYYKKYEEFVLSFEYGMLYYSIKYKSLLEEVLGLKSNYLILLNEENDIQAILPLMKKKANLEP